MLRYVLAVLRGQAVLLLRSLMQSSRLDIAWGVLAPSFRSEFQIDEDRGRLKSMRLAV